VAATLTYRHLRLVPRQYHRSSGLAHAQILVPEVRHFPYRYLRHQQGGATEIPPSAYCELHLETGERLRFLVDITLHSKLAEALLRMAESLFTGNRAQRYVTLFKAYECLAASPDIALAAVRHGLSHATTALSRPNTTNSLKLLFGTTKIDLDLAPHRRIFYRQLVSLFLETDRLVAAELMRVHGTLRRLAPGEVPLTEWNIKGIPGVMEPIPIRQCTT
jgi:hypothetical protein